MLSKRAQELKAQLQEQQDRLRALTEAPGYKDFLLLVEEELRQAGLVLADPEQPESKLRVAQGAHRALRRLMDNVAELTNAPDEALEADAVAMEVHEMQEGR
jgi:hypothetical protein